MKTMKLLLCFCLITIGQNESENELKLFGDLRYINIPLKRPICSEAYVSDHFSNFRRRAESVEYARCVKYFSVASAPDVVKQSFVP